MGGGIKSGAASHEDKLTELARDLENLRELAPVYSFWNHRKTGGTYQVTGHCVLEATMAPAILYTRHGITWCRPGVEFLDGRFEEWTED